MTNGNATETSTENANELLLPLLLPLPLPILLSIKERNIFSFDLVTAVATANIL